MMAPFLTTEESSNLYQAKPDYSRPLQGLEIDKITTIIAKMSWEMFDGWFLENREGWFLGGSLTPL